MTTRREQVTRLRHRLDALEVELLAESREMIHELSVAVTVLSAVAADALGDAAPPRDELPGAGARIVAELELLRLAIRHGAELSPAVTLSGPRALVWSLWLRCRRGRARREAWRALRELVALTHEGGAAEELLVRCGATLGDCRGAGHEALLLTLDLVEGGTAAALSEAA